MEVMHEESMEPLDRYQVALCRQEELLRLFLQTVDFDEASNLACQLLPPTQLETLKLAAWGSQDLSRDKMEELCDAKIRVGRLLSQAKTHGQKHHWKEVLLPR